jgi:hypothetical protein
MLPWASRKITHFLALSTKLRLHKTPPRSVLMYGSERWTLTTNNIERLRVFERKMLRRIFGPACENGFWRIRYKNELYKLFSEPDIVKPIKI